MLQQNLQCISPSFFGNPSSSLHDSFSSQNSNISDYFSATAAFLSSNFSRCRNLPLKYPLRDFKQRGTILTASFSSYSRTGAGRDSFGSNTGALPPRIFVGYSIYKGKSVLNIVPKSPEFVLLESGSFKVGKEGSVGLEFAHAIGNRKYDWTKKQVFSLSPTEIGALIGLGVNESCEFFHDPFKGRSDEGQVMKFLKVEPLRDGSGHFFSLTVQNKLSSGDENIYVPVTKAEFSVMASALRFILPYLLGWSAFADSIVPRQDASGSGNSSTNNVTSFKPIEGLEWGSRP